VKNWSAAFLPAHHQGTIIRPGTDEPIRDISPAEGLGDYVTRQSESAAQALIGQLNRWHAAERRGDERLEARIRSYELAARMQLAAPEALDISEQLSRRNQRAGRDRLLW
jgi:hypothetical protein